MLILDTDHLSIVDQDTREAFNLGRRLASVPQGEVTVTIITYEEQMRGWLAYVARANSPGRQIEAYQRLRLHVDRFRQISIMDYDVSSVERYEDLRQARIRIGTQDLKDCRDLFSP